MEPTALTDLVEIHLDLARRAGSGRSAVSVFGHAHSRLHQTLIAIAGGRGLAEHESPGDATLQVLAGRVRLDAGTDSVELGVSDLAAIPDARHSLEALEDAVVLLTVGVR